MIKIFEDWFVIQVHSGLERRVFDKIGELRLSYFKPFLPTRALKIRFGGVIKETHNPIYPGYIFIIGSWNSTEAMKISQIPGVFHFIGGRYSPEKVKNYEKEVVLNLSRNLSNPDSKVIKNGSKIKIVSGPLKQLEGFIESVDRRKRKVFLNLPLLGNSVRVSLGIEFIESTESH